jgi:hypothetical protein
MVLYEYDFRDPSGDGADRLSLRGQAQLRNIAHFLPLGRAIVIQASPGGASLDELRRKHVLRQLEKLEIGVSPEQVVVARVPVTGLGAAGEQDNPEEANWNVIYRNRLQQTREQGPRRFEQSLQIGN